MEFADTERLALLLDKTALFFTQHSTSILMAFHQTRLGFAATSMPCPMVTSEINESRTSCGRLTP